MARKEMLLEDISYLELWQPLCSADRNHLCNFNRRHHEKQFCEIILLLDQWFRRKCRLKVFLIWSSGHPPVTIYAILKEVIMGNIHVKLYKFGPVVQEEMSFKDISYLLI